MASLNRAILSDYQGGLSIRDVAKKNGVSYSRAQRFLSSAGKTRDLMTAAENASRLGRLGKGSHPATFPRERCENISKGRAAWSEKNAKGVSRKARGHFQFTKGPNKGRSVHVVKMEDRIGRRLLPDECVHHIDGNPSNNSDSNLALMTVAGHARLHRREEAMSGKIRKRKANGQFS